jgi:hypothetical protein
MCWKVVCSNCKKYTWDGCGKHIESVKKIVPPDQWCDRNCKDRSKKESEPKSGSNSN